MTSKIINNASDDTNQANSEETTNINNDIVDQYGQVSSRLDPNKSDDSPKVSILIPTYNRANYIELAIHSAMAQSRSPLEILIVDDGSTDGTAEKVRAINDPRLRYIIKEHSGAPSTRNRAVREARGEFILWLDSDDVLLEDALKLHLENLKSYPDIDVSYGNLIIFEDDFEKQRPFNYPDWYGKNELLIATMFQKNPVPNPSTLIRKTCFERIGYYNEEFRRVHDYEWWARLAPVASFKHCGHPLLLWRWHEDNMSTGTVKKDFSFDRRIVRGLFEKYPLKELYPLLDWSIQPDDASVASALLMSAQRFFKIDDVEMGSDCLLKAYQHNPNSEIRSLLETCKLPVPATSKQHKADRPQLDSLIAGADQIHQKAKKTTKAKNRVPQYLCRVQAD